MSRILGRANDVLQASISIQKDFPKYKKDKSLTTWDNIEKVKEDIEEENKKEEE